MRGLDACQVVAELSSQALDEPLSLLDRLRLRVHLALCGDCRSAGAQIAQLGPFLRDLMNAED